jgi:hypothetical protein
MAEGGILRDREAAVGLGSGSFSPHVASAVAFTVIVSGIVLAARFASQAPVEAGEGEVDPETGLVTEPKGPLPDPLTPATARSARELNAALLKRFGTNGRGMAFVTVVDYDPHPDRLHISFPLDELDAEAPTARTTGLKKARDLLASLRGGQMRWTWVLLTGTAPLREESGKVSEATVMRMQFSREWLDRADPDRLGPDDLKGAAEQFWLHPELRQ